MCDIRSSFARRTTVWLGAVALALNAIPAHRQTAPGLDAATSNAIARLAITDATVIDVETGTHRPGLTILTEGDRIAAVGPEIAVPRGATKVSGKGKFVIPGLWDMHTHHQGTGAQSLDLFVAKGVVGTRDMGGDANFILPLREQVRANAVFGPEIVTSGPMVDNAPPDFPYRLHVKNADEAKAAVNELKTLESISSRFTTLRHERSSSLPSLRRLRWD